MLRTPIHLLLGTLLGWSLFPAQAAPSTAETSTAETSTAEIAPVEHIYATVAGVDLRAFVLSPPDAGPAPRPAVVVFHGGGWSIGEAAWAIPRARHYAEQGLVGVAAQYRLSDQAEVTPIEAMADARRVIRWLRTHADTLGIDPRRIAAYGWSAGGHLAAAAALFDDAATPLGTEATADGAAPDGAAPDHAAPDALILVSPAVSIAGSNWVRRLLGGRAAPVDISPHAHLRPGMPPTLVLQGRTDTVTPTPGVVAFCEGMREAGNRCELEIYEGVGHLFTPATEPDDDWPNPDPAVRDAASRRADAFLRSLGFLD